MYHHTPTPTEPKGKKREKKVPCEVWSRVCGYIRPVQSWNDGKRQEFEDRQTYRKDAAGSAGSDC